MPKYLRVVDKWHRAAKYLSQIIRGKRDLLKIKAAKEGKLGLGWSGRERQRGKDAVSKGLSAWV